VPFSFSSHAYDRVKRVVAQLTQRSLKYGMFTSYTYIRQVPGSNIGDVNFSSEGFDFPECTEFER